MLGSNNKYFKQSPEVLLKKREMLITFLNIKEFKGGEIKAYLRAYDYFCKNTNDFDGETIVKDSCDLPDLSLNGMLHDYHYLAYNSASNFEAKFKADWIYFKQNERLGKDNKIAFLLFILLTIAGIGFVPYAYLKRGKRNWYQEWSLDNDYKILIKR